MISPTLLEQQTIIAKDDTYILTLTSIAKDDTSATKDDTNLSKDDASIAEDAVNNYN